MLTNIPKHLRGVGRIAVLSGLLALACSDDDADPLSAQERQLIGEWQLDLGNEDEADFAFTYRFDEDHTVRNRRLASDLRESTPSQVAVTRGALCHHLIDSGVGCSIFTP